MSGTSQFSEGMYEAAALPPANTKKLTPFTTSSWAGMNELFVEENDQSLVYPNFADGLSGYMPSCDRNHPLRRIEAALAGQLHTTPNSKLRLLSYQVGEVVDPERKDGINEWEKRYICELEETLPHTAVATIPERASWDREQLVEYYGLLRRAEAEQLREEVARYAGVVVAQNEVQQLFVAREKGLVPGTGWLAPLVGLAIDTKDNDYTQQAHDVLAVIKQTDGSPALLLGANASLYTAYAPRKGLATSSAKE